MNYLVTGAAGFIGFHVCLKLLQAGEHVIGLDNFNDYYDSTLKHARILQLKNFKNFEVFHFSIEENEKIKELFCKESFDRVIHLAAQAGVRYSIDHPRAYAQSNLLGFLNILEACRHHAIAHLVYASSSSVYGGNSKMPFCEIDSVDHPVSLYAATKRANELMAHSYAHLFNLPCTGLRFFTVYGPWGRPDMAYFQFADAISRGKPIHVFNEGKLKRDFTYIDDIVDGILKASHKLPIPTINLQKKVDSAFTPQKSWAPYALYNLGNNQSIEVLYMIELLEKELGKKATYKWLPMQPGDVEETYADLSHSAALLQYAPKVKLEEGIKKFVSWYKEYYKI